MGNAASVGRKIRESLSQTIREVMWLAADNVTNATPVDTTHAANNWILSVRAPCTTVDGSRERPSHALQDAGKQKLLNYDVGRDGPVFLRNNVLYLQYLDQGHSQQAPAGFVTIALMNAMRRAPYGRKEATRKMLKRMARAAYVKGI